METLPKQVLDFVIKYIDYKGGLKKMTYMDWIELGLNVLAGLAVAIPAVISLINFVKAIEKEKNWSSLLSLVLGYMETAETNFQKGVDRKEWVMSMMRQSAAAVNFNYDEEAEKKISALIDSICDTARKINNK